MVKNKNYFSESLIKNQRSYTQYLAMLTELSISMFEWKNLPPTVDSRYMELSLFESGSIIYFNDKYIGDLCLNCLANGNFDVYGEPIRRRAYSKYNGYNRFLSKNNSVIIWNNLLRTNSTSIITQFAERLYNLDRIIDVNVNAQKTPILIQGSEKQKLTLINVYKEYDGNSPVIFGDKNLDLNSISVLKTDAPYTADKIYALKSQIWNEALTYLGISNVSIQKKERMVADEVNRNLGGTIASRYSRLESRQTGAEKINNMFGTNIEVSYRENFEEEFVLDVESEVQSNE